MSKTAIATTDTQRQEEIFIAQPFNKIQRISVVKMQLICHWLQSRKSNALVTFHEDTSTMVC
jgi:ABC-type lipopolysaccharide export system ATPase subunit